ALWPLLQKSAAPKLVNISSIASSITLLNGHMGAYGPSKAALNWLTRSIHLQHEQLIAFAVHPGLVQTDMGAYAAKRIGLDWDKMETVEGSVGGILDVIDNATREKTSGKLVSYKGGEEMPW
ncbi:hypothetical protein F66182_6317, partial [Fusarium sp. NRRL 66182]